LVGALRTLRAKDCGSSGKGVTKISGIQAAGQARLHGEEALKLDFQEIRRICQKEKQRE
jgi:hypothetical protein